MASYHKACRDAENALQLKADSEKARYRLSKALYHLRSYQKALDQLRPIATSSDPNIKSLLQQLITCVAENRYGEFDINKIETESKENPRLAHSDYCTNLIELRHSQIGGKSGRGIFAKKDIPLGTLLVASKAIDCVFADEPETTRRFILTHTPEAPNYDLAGRLRLALTHRLHSMIVLNNYGRGILTLDGGILVGKTDINLCQDDVYGEIESVGDITPEAITEIIDLNCFTISRHLEGRTVEGCALYYLPSFFNHSCMPNTVFETHGDMMFIRSGNFIPAGTEILTTYLKPAWNYSYQHRSNFLQRRRNPFVCNCPLCQFDETRADIVKPTFNITREMLAKYKSPEQQLSKIAITELKAARLRIYKLFGFLLPENHLNDVQRLERVTSISSDTPLQFVFARSLNRILKMLVSALYQQGERYEAMQFCAEAFAYMKGNLVVAEAPCEAINSTLTIWAYLRDHQNPSFCGPLASYWFQEFKNICTLVAGKRYFESKYSLLVKAVESRVADRIQGRDTRNQGEKEKLGGDVKS